MNIYMDDVRELPVDMIGWVVCRQVVEVQAFLRQGVVDYLSLDHDMGVCPDCLQREPGLGSTLHCRHIPDGTALCNWMEETGCWPRHKPLIHSANPVGRKRMAQIVNKYWDD